MLLSVLSVEPYGMKHEDLIKPPEPTELSVLSVEPYGMKRARFSASRITQRLSVLSVEPYGMKLLRRPGTSFRASAFSALGRAVWDETRSHDR